MIGAYASEIPFACPDCGKVRYYPPSHRSKSARCQSCAARHRQKIIKEKRMTKRNALTFPQRIQMLDAIKAATEPDGADHVRYRDGDSDAMLAARLPFSVSVKQVETMRAANVGKLRPIGNPRFSAGNTLAKDAAKRRRVEMRNDIDALTNAVALMRAEIAALRDVVSRDAAPRISRSPAQNGAYAQR